MAQPVLQPHFYPMHSGPFTPADREAMPDDGRRVELIDGCLVVSPSSGQLHNDVVMHLFRLLDSACPDDLTIYNVPYDYRLPDDSELVPDITVARTADLGPKRITAPVPAYWTADPVAGRMTVLELTAGGYVQRAVVEQDDVALERPFPVTVHLRGLPSA